MLFNQSNDAIFKYENKVFKLYDSLTLKLIQNIKLNFNNITYIDVLYRTCYIGIVCDHILYIYNIDSFDIENTLEFTKSIIKVILRGKKIVVVCEDFIYCYNGFINPKLAYSIETPLNKKGLCCLSKDRNILVTIHKTQGCVLIINLDDDSKNNIVLQAHKGEISALGINEYGDIICTASDNGTLLRGYNIKDGSKLYEFRIGYFWSTINNIFINNKYIICDTNYVTDNYVNICDLYEVSYNKFSSLPIPNKTIKLKINSIGFYKDTIILLTDNEVHYIDSKDHIIKSI